MLSDEDLDIGTRASDDDSNVPLAMLERIDTGSLLANVMDDLPSMSSPPEFPLIGDEEYALNRTVSDWLEGEAHAEPVSCEKSEVPPAVGDIYGGGVMGDVGVGSGSVLYCMAPCVNGGQLASDTRVKVEQPECGAAESGAALLSLPTRDSGGVVQTAAATGAYGLRTCQLGGDMELPCLLPFAGDLDFSVTVADVDSGGLHQQQPAGRTAANKLASYVYTRELGKVYVDMMATVPFRLQCRQAATWPHRLPPLFVRCLPVYPNSDQLLEPVLRCPAHRQSSHPSNRHLTSATQLPHLVRALSPHALYRQSSVCLRTRYSVLVPWSTGNGAPFTLLSYQFACMNTCVGGVARRRLALLFQLEDAECRVYGRAMLQLKVCKCPHRDARHELVRWRRANPTSAACSGAPQPGVDRPLASAMKREACLEDGGSAIMDDRASKRSTLEKRSEELYLPVANCFELKILEQVRDNLRRFVKDYKDPPSQP